MGATDIISIVKDILLGLSAITIAFFAWLGLQTWRRELTGKARFETARNMMRLGSGLKAAFGEARSLFTSSTEYVGRTIQDEETERESPVLNQWYARNNLLKPVVENLNKIIEAQWEAEILLNESSEQAIREAVQSFKESYADLSSAISAYFETRRDEARTGDPYNDQEWLKGLTKIIYGVPTDDFSKKIADATDTLSSTLKQFVK